MLCASLVLWRHRDALRRDPIVIASAAAAMTLVLATAFGIAPVLSFFAPGVRHEGTWLALALVAIGFAVASLEPQHRDVVVKGIVIGGIGPSVYAIGQAIAPSVGDATWTSLPRVGSTFGNPVLLGGYLAIVMPITAATAMAALTASGGAERPGPSPWLSAGYWIVLGVQAAALLVARARGAWIATAVAVVVVVGGRMDAAHRRRFIIALAAGGLVIVVAGGLFVRGRPLPADRTLQVRVAIYGDVARMLAARPSRLLLGYGPETLQSVVGPFRSAEVARLEGPFAVTDRAHNDGLDALAATGLCGAAAVMALHVLLWIRLGGGLPAAGAVWTTRDWTVLGLLAAAVAHFVEIQVGIAHVSSRLVWWCIVGIAIAQARDTTAPLAEPAVAPSARDAIALAGFTALAALMCAFGQRSTDTVLAAAGLPVIVAVGALAASIGINWSTAEVRVVARRLVGSAVVVGVMWAVLAYWGATDGPPAGSDIVSAADWLSYRATVWYLMFGAAAVVIGSIAGSRTDGARRSHRMLFLAIPTGILSLVVGARTVRADILAHVGDQMKDAERWGEAEQVQRRRVQVTPESDAAWSALGGAEMELGRRAVGSERADRFARSVAALAEARRRDPWNWLHSRNQASAERVWAAADPLVRAAHLRTADDFYRQAASLAPASARLWAEWGNVDAERGALPEALAKLERAAALGDDSDAEILADAILRATGTDVSVPGGLERAAAQFRREGRQTLAALYQARAATPH